MSKASEYLDLKKQSAFVVNYVRLEVVGGADLEPGLQISISDDKNGWCHRSVPLEDAQRICKWLRETFE